MSKKETCSLFGEAAVAHSICMQVSQAFRQKSSLKQNKTLLCKMHNLSLFSFLPYQLSHIYMFFHVSTIAQCLWVIMNEYLTILPAFTAQQRLNSIELADCFLIFCLDGLFFVLQFPKYFMSLDEEAKRLENVADLCQKLINPPSFFTNPCTSWLR